MPDFVRCASCSFSLPVASFPKNRSRKSGLDSYCKRCKYARAKAQRAKTAQQHRKEYPGRWVDDHLPDAAPYLSPPDFDIDVEEPITQDNPLPPSPPSPDDLLREHTEAKERRTAQSDLRTALEENARLKTLLDTVQGLHATPADPYAPAAPVKGDAVACCIASDWHVEEPVEASKVHNLNEYSLAVAEQRARKFFQHSLRLTDIMARDAHIDTLFLGLLGDFITGHIHAEGQETNELAPGAAANYAMSLLATGIDFLLKESAYQLEIDCLPGNHGRMTLKPRIANATETSLETFMYHSLAARYVDNPRVRFRVANSKMLYRRFFEGFNMRLIHGDDVKFGGGVGGITIPIRKKLAAWNSAIRADLTVMGHFHQLMDGGDFVVNGSLIGYNEFAQAIGASPEEARQAFFLVHARGGGQKSITAPIWLDERHKEHA